MANRLSWFGRHKILTVILALVLIGIIAGAASSGSSSNNNKSNSTSTSKNTGNSKQYRFTDRADKQKKDVEVLPGEAATVDGVKMTLTSPEYSSSLGEFEQAGSGKVFLVINVQLENTDNRTHPYNAFDFRVQTVGGQVLDSTASTIDGQLNSGDLVAGGKVSGKVVFEVPQETGHQYIIWKPNALKSDRAIVKVSQSS